MGNILIKQITNKDENFYLIMGRFLSKREIVKEFGCPIWDDDNKIWFLAYDKIDLLGFVSLLNKEDKCTIESAYVLPQYRLKGIFRQLINNVFTYASNNYNKITVIAVNTIVHVYKEHGFIEKRKLKNDIKMEWSKL
ncbi:MAG: GNAT family N-acetyltransferase [Firmicutes bacterium]|nr:GNAT family N-acetyltransferase [Bacillota bacterium]